MVRPHALNLRIALVIVLLSWSCGRIGVELSPSVADGGSVVDERPPPELDGGAALADAAAPIDLDGFTLCLFDVDGDGVCDGVDNCIDVANRAQDDRDGDGLGDACDPCPADPSEDSDGDGVCAAADQCPDDPTKVAPGACGCGVLPTKGLLASYPFDEDSGTVVRDEVSGREGALRNFGSAPFAPGASNSALAFDGVDDRADLGALAGVRALSFWLRASSFVVEATDTGWATPTRNGDPNHDWLEPENAYVSDDRYSNGGLTNGEFHDWHGFGFALPGGTPIRGIEVQIETKNSNPTSIFTVELSWSAGARGSYTNTGRASPLTLIDDTLTFGGPTDTWGRTWSSDQLRDEAFRVRLGKGGINFSPLTHGVDLIRVRAHHSALTRDRVVLALRGDVKVELEPNRLVLTGFPSGTSVFVDGASTTALDGNLHHVAIVSPSAIDAANVQAGGVSGYAHGLEGVLDELRFYNAPLSAEDLALLRAKPGCR